MNNAHMGMWSEIQGKPNTLKGLVVLVLDDEVCDEWQENYDFRQFVTTQVWVRKKTLWRFSTIIHSLFIFRFVLVYVFEIKW